MAVTFKMIDKLLDYKIEVRGIVKHGLTILEKAAKDVFKPEAIISYDTSVRDRAGQVGPTAFGSVEPEDIIRFFCYANTKQKSYQKKKSKPAGGNIQLAYRAVPVRPEHRNYQGFSWEYEGEKRWFVDNRLCFGLRLGPSYFNKISNLVCDILTSKYSLKIVNYLDDFIVVSTDLQSCISTRDQIIETLRFFGFHVSFGKNIFPSTCVTYLGFEIDSCSTKIRLPEGKLNKLKALLDYYASKKRIYKKNLKSIACYLSHCAHVVKCGRFFCRSIYELYK